MTEPHHERRGSGSDPAARRKTVLAAVLVGVVLLVALLAAAVAMAYGTFISRSDSPFIRGTASALRLPAAKVGSRTVLYGDFARSRDTVKVFIASEAAKEQGLAVAFDAELEKNVLEKLIRQAAVEEYAEEKGIAVTDGELRAFFADVVAAASSTTPDVGVYLLENFGWNEEDFRQNVLKPALLEQRVGEAMAEGSQGDSMAFTAWIEERLARPDVVRYVRF
ncbi:SurA N-terminal domain-containing protein [Candidatus Uhrbacteria bacterium]|nr:SurA N-terminal domain-containing protein [Candidatus Uhrbacteria bacterium]